MARRNIEHDAIDFSQFVPGNITYSPNTSHVGAQGPSSAVIVVILIALKDDEGLAL